MLTIGHRGCRDQYPENTIAAIRCSASHIDAVEIDVKRCGSGELVVFHDDYLDRVTNGTGRIGDTAWERLRTLEVLESGERVPLLTEVVASWPADTLMNLDVHDPDVVAEALDVVASLEELVLLSTSSERALSECDGCDVLTGYSFATDPEQGIRCATQYDCDFVHVYHGLCQETDVVERVHDAGLRVDAWSLQTERQVARLREHDVDAVTVDRWDIA